MEKNLISKADWISAYHFIQISHVRSGRVVKSPGQDSSLAELTLSVEKESTLFQTSPQGLPVCVYLVASYTWENSKNKIKQEKPQAKQLLFYPDKALHESLYDRSDSAIEKPFTFSSLILTVNLELYIWQIKRLASLHFSLARVKPSVQHHLWLLQLCRYKFLKDVVIYFFISLPFILTCSKITCMAFFPTLW